MKNETAIQLQRHKRITRIMSTDTEYHLHNITSKATLNYSIEICLSNKNESQKLEVAQMIY
jgi:hypothetical protein